MTETPEETKTPKTRKAATVAPKHKTLVEALAAFQADLPTVTLDGDNPHFKSKFTTLGNLSTTVLPKLAAHGLAFSAGSRVTDEGRLVVSAKLLHESGKYQTAEFPVTETNPQKVGSAVTYFRRYSLAMLTGVVADQDDDGNAASAPAPRSLENARNAASRPAGGTSEADTLKARIREWIGSDDERRKQAVAAQEEASKKGLKGVELQKALIEALGA